MRMERVPFRSKRFGRITAALRHVRGSLCSIESGHGIVPSAHDRPYTIRSHHTPFTEISSLP